MYSHCKLSKSTISNAIQKYGKDNFKFEIILQGLEMKYILSMETYFIKEFNTLSPNGYNLTTGGWCTIVTQKTKEKLRYLAKNRTPGHRIKLGFASKNRICSKYTKEKISRAVSLTLKEKYKNGFNPWLNKKHSEETKRKISLANKIKQAGHKNSQYGSKWIFNKKLKISKKIKLNEFPPVGWELGRKIKF